MITLKEEKTGRLINLDERGVHKYWKPQDMYNGCAFIMQEDFDMGYEGFAIPIRRDARSAPEWVLFWRETVDKYGEKRVVVPGKFRDKPFIRMLVAKYDAREQA